MNDRARWVRLPRWQHLALIVLCTGAVIAAITNIVAAERWTNRLLHAGIGVVTMLLLVALISAYRRRPPEDT